MYIYDTVIIGAGIAGLYAAYKIKKKDPHHKIAIFESEKHIGGRMGTENFHGSQIAIGAGVGRKRKDKLLQKLLQELQIPTHEFKVKTNYANTITTPCDVKQTFQYLKHTYEKHPEPENTFREFATKKLGEQRYQQFIMCAGFTDYENEGVYNTLYYYGFDDNYQQWTALGIPWQKLLQALQKSIGKSNIHKGTLVEHIEIDKTCEVWSEKIWSEALENLRFSDRSASTTNDRGSEVSTRVETPDGSLTGVVWIVSTTNKKVRTKQVIVATTIDVAQRLIPDANHRNSPYQSIKGQPFLRIYGKFTPESNQVIQEYVTASTIVPGPIHKLIPINPIKGIYMIVYTDNKGAKILKKYIENTVTNRKSLCKYLQEALGITQKLELEDIRGFYWPIGTHYYAQHHLENITQNPKPNLYIIGEMISHNQGWVEGALESVDKIM
jgi:hypothetical protein